MDTFEIRTMAALEDFIINGEQLSEKLGAGGPWWGVAKDKKLLSKKNDTVVLYICHCGLRDCGLFTCEIVVEGETVTWKNFCFKGKRKKMRAVKFAKDVYEQKLKAFLEL